MFATPKEGIDPGEPSSAVADGVIARPGSVRGAMGSKPGNRRHWRQIASSASGLAIMLGLHASGCSLNGVGFASSEVISAHGATVIRTQTYGAALRTTTADAGIVFGYTSTLIVTPNGPAAPRPGTYPFGLALLGMPSVATIRDMAGLSFDINRRMVGITAGYSEDAVFARIARDDSVVQHLDLMPGDPARTELLFCPEIKRCE